MMHGPEKSDLAIVAGKPANKVAPHCGVVRGGVSRWSEGRGPRGMRTGKARTGLRARLACHRRRAACGTCLPFGPEVGAVCGKAARTVLCGGRAMKRTSLRLQENEMHGRIEDAVRDLRRELLRELEQLTTRIKKLESRQERQRSEKGEFKFAGERDAAEAGAEPLEVPRFLPAPILVQDHNQLDAPGRSTSCRSPLRAASTQPENRKLNFDARSRSSREALRRAAGSFFDPARYLRTAIQPDFDSAREIQDSPVISSNCTPKLCPPRLRIEGPPPLQRRAPVRFPEPPRLKGRAPSGLPAPSGPPPALV
jgi:hypothetical protein